MRKIILAITAALFVCININAQLLASSSKVKRGKVVATESKASEEKTPDETGCFEGEITYETFENYSEWINRMANSVYVDGVHKMRLIVKGSKMHLIDETTQCHTVINGAYTHYCDITKTGFSMDKWDFMMAAAPRTLDYGHMGQVAKLTENTFKETEQVLTILNKECKLWQGDIVHDMGGMAQRYSCHAYCSDIKASSGYPLHLFGMPLSTIATKWIMKYDGGNVGMMGVGELSFYQEGDVVSITPRSVSDEEFALPTNYKIAKGSIKSVFKMMNYYKGVKKALEKAGIKGNDKSAKSTGVHFKTQEEWDF